ncbi:restriction endonuclease subunit S [Aestuariirhabdus litorea]|uniref:restriction endonuclease subunit S n=1 Tax=Aestuariirhabdus litorea TaxID=2528527 RepID=UPI000F621321|nr:restriction endonuclease subunit S [Aestuariirhabdus litorea]RWW92764.1 restriction endonuclease subunit S [Endozoicomonadaceae bacterium GTF-13]
MNERSELGEEQLLSVSEYYGVKPRQEAIGEGEHLSRAESLVGYKKCETDDLVMNIMLAWKTGLGVSGYDGIVSPAYSVFRFDPRKAWPNYMHYLLRTSLYTGHFKTLSTGVIDSRLRLYPETFSGVSILLPSLTEQRTIAAFLDYETARIDALIARQQRLIELLKEKRQAVISHAVTKGLNPDAPMKDSGVEWLGEVPEHWGLPKLLYVTSRIGDGLHSTPVYEDGTGYYFVNGNNLSNGAIKLGPTSKEVPESEYHKHHIPLDNSSALMSINGTVGNLALYNGEPVILGKSACYINCKQPLNRRFLMAYLRSDEVSHYFDTEVTGTTIYNLSLNSVRQMKVCVPPEKEQEAIIKYCTEQDRQFGRLIDHAVRAIELMKERRTALVSAAVTGKIDLREWERPSA